MSNTTVSSDQPRFQCLSFLVGRRREEESPWERSCNEIPFCVGYKVILTVRASFTPVELNRAFATNDHMVQNRDPPCWRAS